MALGVIWDLMTERKANSRVKGQRNTAVVAVLMAGTPLNIE